MTVAKLAAQVGITPESIYVGSKREDWQPRRGTVAMMAGALGVTPEYLTTGLTGKPAMPQPGESRPSPAVPLDGRFQTAPVYKLSQVSAGRGTPAFGDEAEGRKSVDPEITMTAAGMLAFVRVSGNSMEPTLRDGDLAIVETCADLHPESEVYVLRVNDEVLIKRVSRIGASLRIVSDNENYPSVTYGPEDDINIEMLARVRGLQRSQL